MDEVVASSRAPIESGDAMVGYYRRVKLIYNAIIEFAVSAEEAMNERQRRDVFSLRLVCRQVARAIRVVSHMSPNFDHAANTPNLDLRAQYDGFRTLIGRILRAMYAARTTTDEQTVLITYGELQRELDEADTLSTGTVDYLVRHQLLTSLEATSLMNESGHAHELGSVLIEIGRRMFACRSELLRDLDEELLLHTAPDDNLQDASAHIHTGQHPELLRTSLTGEYRRISREEAEAAVKTARSRREGPERP